MAFSWSSFRLPRPWTRSDEQRDQDDRMPILPHENGRLVMDERLHESLDNDDFQSQSPADGRASLKRVSEQRWHGHRNAQGLQMTFKGSMSVLTCWTGGVEASSLRMAIGMKTPCRKCQL